MARQRFDGSELRRLREASDLTQTELAAKVGRREQMVSLYEKGRAVPPVEMLLTLADVLDARVEDFFEDIETRLPPLEPLDEEEAADVAAILRRGRQANRSRTARA